MTLPSADPSCHSPVPPEQWSAAKPVVKATVVRQEAAGVWLSTPVSTSCSGCQQQDSCSSGLLAKALPVRQQQLFLPDQPQLLPGQQVEITVAADAVLRSALLVYLLPICIFISAAAFGQAMVWHELFTLLVSLFVTALTFRTVRGIEQKRSTQLQISLVRVLPDIQVTELPSADSSA